MWDSGGQGQVIEKEAVVIGAGISGLVTAKCLKDDGFDVCVLERTTDIGGLWKFREKDYGVMSFTHINVSKYNYVFSDYPFPDEAPDYPHHTQMQAYIENYSKHFGLYDLIKFKIQVDSVEQIGEKWRLVGTKMEEDGKTAIPDSKFTIVCSYVAVATGHHAKPTYPKFKGEETFPGEIVHSIDYNDAAMNNFLGKRVLVVGIGNSGVDVAVDCATANRCSNVHLSTRSGAWIFSNYTFAYPTDLYANRIFFYLPTWAKNLMMETVVKITTGHPRKWGLNPKMRIMSTQPTVSPTLIHHIQRHNITMVPNITKIEGSTVHFVNGSSADFDKIVYCTGYKVNLPFLHDSILNTMYSEDSNEVRLYKNVFSPSVGQSLAFIGFVQPASGGIVTMSEIQARWFSAVCKGHAKLPSKPDMETDIKKDLTEAKERWYKSGRHTIQRDPLVYADEISSFIGAKPDILSHPKLAWRLIFSSCGPFQWRLKGPHKWAGAANAVMKTPLPDFANYLAYAAGVIVLVMFYYLYRWTCGLFGC